MNKEIAQALLNYRRVYHECLQLSDEVDKLRILARDAGWDGRTKAVKSYEAANTAWLLGLGRKRIVYDELIGLLMKDFAYYTDDDLERIVNPPSLFPKTFSITPVFKIYTDGGCRPNPGRGACAYVVIDLITGTKYGDHVEVWLNTTNNQMELQAVIQALSSLEDQRAKVFMVVDSEYVKLGITEWINNWEKRGWKTAVGVPVKNKHLWQKLKTLVDKHDIEWQWVKGHAGDKWNEYCDQLCTEALNADSTG